MFLAFALGVPMLAVHSRLTGVTLHQQHPAPAVSNLRGKLVSWQNAATVKTTQVVHHVVSKESLIHCQLHFPQAKLHPKPQTISLLQRAQQVHASIKPNIGCSRC